MRGRPALSVIAFLCLALAAVLLPTSCAKGYISPGGDELTEQSLRVVLREIAYNGAPAAGHWAAELADFCKAGYPDVCGVYAFALSFVAPGGGKHQVALSRAEVQTNTYGSFAFGYDRLTRADNWRGAMPYFERACNHDLPLGCTHFGSIIVAHSLPGSQNEKTGSEYWKLACRAGEGTGCFFLARYLEKKGRPATGYYERSCRLGYGPGCRQAPAKQ